MDLPIECIGDMAILNRVEESCQVEERDLGRNAARWTIQHQQVGPVRIDKVRLYIQTFDQLGWNQSPVYIPLIFNRKLVDAADRGQAHRRRIVHLTHLSRLRT